eukprot:99891-Rhodomonas_salina.4
MPLVLKLASILCAPISYKPNHTELHLAKAGIVARKLREEEGEGSGGEAGGGQGLLLATAHTSARLRAPRGEKGSILSWLEATHSQGGEHDTEVPSEVAGSGEGDCGSGAGAEKKGRSAVKEGGAAEPGLGLAGAGAGSEGGADAEAELVVEDGRVEWDLVMRCKARKRAPLKLSVSDFSGQPVRGVPRALQHGVAGDGRGGVEADGVDGDAAELARCHPGAHQHRRGWGARCDPAGGHAQGQVRGCGRARAHLRPPRPHLQHPPSLAHPTLVPQSRCRFFPPPDPPPFSGVAAAVHARH